MIIGWRAPARARRPAVVQNIDPWLFPGAHGYMDGAVDDLAGGGLDGGVDIGKNEIVRADLVDRVSSRRDRAQRKFDRCVTVPARRSNREIALLDLANRDMLLQPVQAEIRALRGQRHGIRRDLSGWIAGGVNDDVDA